MSEQSGGYANAAWRRRIPGSIADMDSTTGQRLDDLRHPVASATHDEVRGALRMFEAEPPAGCVETLARLCHLRGVARQEIVILERRQRRRHGHRVDVERQRDRADRIERRWLTDDDPDAHAGEAVGLGE